MKTLKQILNGVLVEVDSRSRYEKLKALADHPSTHENIRKIAKAALAKETPSKRSHFFSDPDPKWSNSKKFAHHFEAAEYHNVRRNEAVKKGKKEEAEKHWDEYKYHRQEQEKYT